MNNNIPKIIKNDEEHEKVLCRIEELINISPQLGTKESDELELLAFLVSKYEEEKYPKENVDPIEAIKFRMEQGGLNQRDLIPLIGSRVKVSEVLNKKRPLTLKMIRALNKHLEIPLESLINEPDIKITMEESKFEWNKLPFIEITKRNLFPEFEKTGVKIKEFAEEIGCKILKKLNQYNLDTAYYKQNIRKGSEIDYYSLLVWKYAIILKIEAKIKSKKTNFDINKLDDNFFNKIKSFNNLKYGPLEVQKYLEDYNIFLITQNHFKRTHLDGACFKLNGFPIIAMTLRYNRIDNFWFVLMHEIGHIKNDLCKDEIDEFIDDLDVNDNNAIEVKADKFALNSLINDELWQEIKENLDIDRSFYNLSNLSKKYNINEAIIAGRYRKEINNFKIFSRIVTDNKVRHLFENQ